MKADDNHPVLSVVIPVLDEEKTLREMYRQLIPVLEDLVDPFEVIFVNDGSRDRSLDVLQEIHRQDPRCKYISLSRCDLLRDPIDA